MAGQQAHPAYNIVYNLAIALVLVVFDYFTFEHHAWVVFGIMVALTLFAFYAMYTWIRGWRRDRAA